MAMTATDNFEKTTELKPTVGPKKTWLWWNRWGNRCGLTCRTCLLLALIIIVAVFTGILWQRQEKINKKWLRLQVFHQQHTLVQGSIESLQRQSEQQKETITQLQIKLRRQYVI